MPFLDLAKEFDLMGGKWVIHVHENHVNTVWKKLVWALAFNKFPPTFVQVRVTPTSREKGQNGHTGKDGENEKSGQSNKELNGDKNSKKETEENVGKNTSEQKDEAQGKLTEKTDQVNETKSQKSEKPDITTEKPKYLHVVTIWNRDHTKEEDILAAEKVIRDIGVKNRMVYKPDIFSAIGVYRGNPWQLRPAILTSRFSHEDKKSVIDSAIDLQWKLQRN